MFQDFSLSICHRGMLSTITCSGELDGANSARLRYAVAMTLVTRPTILEFDGTRLSYIDRDGIEAVFHLARECKRRGIAARISCSPPASQALDRMGLSWLEGADEMSFYADHANWRTTQIHLGANDTGPLSSLPDARS